MEVWAKREIAWEHEHDIKYRNMENVFYFLNNSRSSALQIGIILAICNFSGKTPISKDELIMFINGTIMIQKSF